MSLLILRRLAYAEDYKMTKEVRNDRDFNNYKPYRTEQQKVEARRTAVKVKGTWVSKAPKSYHKKKPG